MSVKNRRKHNRQQREQSTRPSGGSASPTQSKASPLQATSKSSVTPRSFSGARRPAAPSHRPRVQSGVPQGGEFIAHPRDEAAVELAIGIIGTREHRRAGPTELDRFNEQFDDLDAFVFDGDEIVDVDLNEVDGKGMSQYQTLASHGYDSALN